MQQQHERVDEPLRLGDRGLAVVELRHRLRQLELLPTDEVAGGAPALDAFDDACDLAVRSFQQQRGLRIDGVVDRETYRGLDEARWRLGDRPLSFAVRHPYVGDDVAALQHRLIDMGFDCGRADGVFGPRTENALREFQRNVGLPADGACGPATFRALRQLARTVVGGKANELREYERLHHGGPTMAGKLVVIDPGHGGADRGSTNGVLDEAGLVDDIANRVEGRLAAAGALAYRTRGGEGRRRALATSSSSTGRQATPNVERLPTQPKPTSWSPFTSTVMRTLSAAVYRRTTTAPPTTGRLSAHVLPS